MIKGWIQEEDTACINIYVLDIGAPKYIKQMLTKKKGETDNTVNSGGLSHPDH